MESSDHKGNSSSSTTSKQRPSIRKAKGADENGRSYQEIGKPTKTKHFMSPTVYGTSKFNSPRKKILAERNESIGDLQKTPNIDSNSVRKASSFDSNRSSRTDLTGSEHNSRPYDPLTNYLSPRPKFLRYKPNRRLEVLLRRETEEKEGDNDAVAPNSELDSVSSCSSLPQLEGGEVEESDDEFEEEEEEGSGSGLKGAFKFLLLMLVLVLCTSYVSSMNSPTPSPVVQAVVSLRDGYHKMQNHAYGYVNQIFLLFDGVTEEKRVSVARMEGTGNEQNEVQFEDEEVGKPVEAEEIKEDEEEIVEIEGGGEADRFIEGENEDEPVEEEGSKEEEEEIPVDGKENPDFGNSEVSEAVEDIEEGGEADRFIEDEEIVEGEEWNETAELDGVKIQDFGNSEVLEKAEVSVSDSLEKEEADSVQGSIKEEIFKAEMVPIGNFTEVHKIGDETESVLKVVIGLSVFILCSIIAGLNCRKRRNGRENTHSPLPVAEPVFESPVPDDEDKPTESAANFLIPKSLIDSMDEASKATHERSHWTSPHESRAAPTFELLGELEVAEMSISFRSCGIKNTSAIESEVSSHSVSIMEKTTISSKPRPSSPYPVDVRTPASLQISTFNHPSHSDDKRSAKRRKESEGGNESEGKKVSITTPLRRSSRIRNRVTSP